MSITSVIDAYSNETQSLTSSDSTPALDTDAFLQLLLTEIEYQNPLDPMDSTEYVTQLAELSELEQLSSISGSMGSVTDEMNEIQSISSLNYLGKGVTANGKSIALADGEASTIYVDLAEEAAELTINIFDSNGNIVNSYIYNNVAEGMFNYTWDGLDYDGESMDNGKYKIGVSALDEDGDAVDSELTIAGTVMAVEFTSDGVELTLDDGRTVDAANVSLVASN